MGRIRHDELSVSEKILLLDRYKVKLAASLTAQTLIK